MTLTATTDSIVRIVPSLAGLLAVWPPEQLLGVLRALEFEELHVFLETTIERHADLPGSGKDFRILDRGFVRQVIRTEGGEALHHMQALGVEIPGSVEPMLAGRPLWREKDGCGEGRDIDDERIRLPSPVRPPHPTIDGRLSRLAHVDFATGIRVLVHDRHPFPTAADAGKDLKRIRQIRGAWYTRQMTLQLRVERQPVLVVLLLFGERPRLVGDLPALHDAQPWRRGADRAECHHL